MHAISEQVKTVPHDTLLSQHIEHHSLTVQHQRQATWAHVDRGHGRVMLCNMPCVSVLSITAATMPV